MLVCIVPFSMLGEGAMSKWREMQTAPCEPTPPTEPVTVRTTCKTITVGWGMPLHQHGSRVTWFEVTKRRAAGGPYKEFAKIACTESTKREATLKDLEAGEGFRFKVRAKNSVGFSEWSIESRVLRTNTGKSKMNNCSNTSCKFLSHVLFLYPSSFLSIYSSY